MIRTGACKVVEVYAPTEAELDKELAYLVRRTRSLSDVPLHLLTYKKEEHDDEYNTKYWMGVMLYDFFFEGWVEPEDFDPQRNVVIIDVQDKMRIRAIT